MLSNIWNTVLYQPLLNALAFLVSIIPGGDVGLAVIILTILVKIILFPLSQKSIESQAQMNILTPELNKIKASGASKEEQARQTFELYKQHKTNPFSGCLLVLIQIPIIFALYYVFYKGINFESGLLYSFIHIPEHVNMVFLGILDITEKSLVLAILAGVSQYLQAHFMPKP
ncbi:MAG: YidC/Oxa1 family membrane protein insertase, partial [Patescibacteria group bacterium]